MKEQALRADAFVDTVGVNVHLHYFDTAYGNYALIKQRLLDSGIRHVRDGVDYSPTDTAFNAAAIGRYADLALSGIRVNAILDPRLTNLKTVTPALISAILALAGNSIEGIESFEGPNEYDFSGDAQWVTTLRSYQQALYTAVKQVVSLPVIAPSLQPYNIPAAGSFAGIADYANMHSYSGGNMPSYGLDQIANTNGASVPGKPMMPTECGYHNALATTGGFPAVSEAAAAKYIPRLLLEYFNRGFARTYIYELIDLKPDTANSQQENHFGLLHNDGTSKPSFTALSNLIKILSDPGISFFPGELDYYTLGALGTMHHTLLQKRDGRFYLILWQEVSSFDLGAKQEIQSSSPVTVVFANPRNVNVYYPLNSANAANHYQLNQQVTVAVSDHPTILEISL